MDWKSNQVTKIQVKKEVFRFNDRNLYRKLIMFGSTIRIWSTIVRLFILPLFYHWLEEFFHLSQQYILYVTLIIGNFYLHYSCSSKCVWSVCCFIKKLVVVSWACKWIPLSDIRRKKCIKGSSEVYSFLVKKNRRVQLICNALKNYLCFFCLNFMLYFLFQYLRFDIFANGFGVRNWIRNVNSSLM